jgi:multidrug efflux pump subunit AcrA (membrane-fusion protein)
MHATDTPETLPPATTLGRSAQWRWLGIAAAVLIGIGLLVSLIGKLTHHEEAPPPASPPGTFRPSAEQMAALTTMRVGDSLSDAATLASGAITVDGDRSTPVVMPYSGQVVRVLVDAGQRVSRGQALMLVADHGLRRRAQRPVRGTRGVSECAGTTRDGAADRGTAEADLRNRRRRAEGLPAGTGRPCRRAGDRAHQRRSPWRGT